MKQPEDISNIVTNALTENYSQRKASRYHDKFNKKYKARHLDDFSRIVGETGHATLYYLEQVETYARMVSRYFPKTRKDLKYNEVIK